MFKDLLNFSFLYRIFIALVSVFVIKFLNIEFSSEVVNNFLLIFSSSGVFAILSLGINDNIAFNEEQKGVNKYLFLFYSLMSLGCILISISIHWDFLALLSFIFIYPMITFDRVFQNTGNNIKAYTIQATLTFALLFYLLINYTIKLPFFYFPLFALMVIIINVFLYSNRFTNWNNNNPIKLIKLNFLTENIQFTVLFGLDIILSSFFTNSNISNQFIILTRFFSLFQMIIFVIPNNYYLVLNGTYNFQEFKKRYFPPIFTLLLFFSTIVFIFSPNIFNFFLNNGNHNYSLNTFYYIIIFTITSSQSLLGSINTVFIKSNQKLFSNFIKLQYIVLSIIIFLMILLYFKTINYSMFLLIKASIIFLFTISITYKIQNEIHNNNT
jgi:hypothetical protein